jgi:hypothetical protein
MSIFGGAILFHISSAIGVFKKNMTNSSIQNYARSPLGQELRAKLRCWLLVEKLRFWMREVLSSCDGSLGVEQDPRAEGCPDSPATLTLRSHDGP